MIWKLEVKFDSAVTPAQLGGEGGGGDPLDPASWRPVGEWDEEFLEELMVKDPVTGKPIENANGEVITMSRQVVIPVRQITRYELWPFDPDTILTYVNHTNSEPFYGAPAGSAVMRSIRSKEVVVEGGLYEQVVYRVAFKILEVDGAMIEGGWNYHPLHEGFLFKHRLVDTQPWQTHMHEVEGHPVHVNLHANGSRIEVDAYGNEPPPEYLDFNRYPRVDLDALSLGPF